MSVAVNSPVDEDVAEWVAQMNLWLGEGGTYRVDSDNTPASCLVVACFFFPLLFGFIAVISGDIPMGLVSGIAVLALAGGFVFIRRAGRNTFLYLNADEVGRTNGSGYPIVWAKRPGVLRPSGASRTSVTGDTAQGWNAAQYQLLLTLLKWLPPADFGSSIPVERSVDEVQEEVRRLFHFGPHEIKLNREGKLSTRQLLFLCQRQARSLLGAAVMMIVVVLVARAFAHGLDWWAYGKGIVAILVALVLFVYLTRRTWAVAADITGEVASCSGKLLLTPRDTWWEFRPNLVLPNCPGRGQFSFAIPAAGPDRLPEEISGIVYFMPRSSCLLGVEVASVGGFRRPVHKLGRPSDEI